MTTTPASRDLDAAATDQQASPSLLARLIALGRDIKLAHSVFALPFALLATFLAAASRAAPQSQSPGWITLSLVILCMVLARTVAMAVNRWADRQFDAHNPRTAGRAIPAGRLSPTFVLGVAISCAGLFIAATAGFWVLSDNLWPILLSPLVLAWLAGYSYAKRFTSLCHLYLGASLALSPIAAAIAVEPAFLAQPDVYLLAIMVLCWVAGFDVLYALQDIDIDREQGLYSLPATLGPARSLWISRALHTLAAAALIALLLISPDLHTLFTIGITLTLALLIAEHLIVWKSRTRHLSIAFFTLNGIISLILGGLGIVDVLSRT